ISKNIECKTGLATTILEDKDFRSTKELTPCLILNAATRKPGRQSAVLMIFLLANRSQNARTATRKRCRTAPARNADTTRDAKCWKLSKTANFLFPRPEDYNPATTPCLQSSR